MVKIEYLAGAKSALILTVVACVLSVFCGAAIAQERGQQVFVNTEAPVIRAISVRGNQRIEPETIASYLVVQAGDRADEQLLDIGLKTLFNTGLFADVSMAMQPDSTLLIEVKENPIVNRVILDGNKRVKDDKITEEIQVGARSIFTRSKIQADVQRIIEVYRRTGRFAAIVTPKVTQLEQNRVDVIYEIDEGPKTGVAKVNFIGNTVFTSGELRSVILTKESAWWQIFSSNSNYDPDRLEYERELLRQHYARNGYADFQVVSAVAELTPDRKDFFITFTVEEGPQYEIGDVKVKTSLAKLDESVLERFVSIKQGQMYDGERIEKAVEQLTFATGATGYAFVDVNPSLNRNKESKTIDLTFNVNEGPRVYVERINIRGNTTTLDKVIRREMRIVEGDAFNRVLVDRSKARVRSLGFFEEVEVEEKPGSAPDRTELDVSVKERPTGSFTVGVGVSSTDNFIVDLSVEQRNLRGTGQFLRFRVQASQRTRQVDIRFTQPYFLNRNLAAGFSLFNQRTNFIEAGFVRDRIGFGLNAGFQISEYGRGSLQYSLARDNIELDRDNIFNQATFSLPDNVDVADILAPGAEFIGDPVPLFFGPSIDADGNILTDADGNTVLVQTTSALAPDGSPNPRATVSTTDLTPISNVTAFNCDLVSQQFSSFCQSEGNFVTSLVGASVSFDSRNDPIRPTRGGRLSISTGFAGLGGDVNFYRTEGVATYYKPIYKGFVGKLQFRGGFINGFAGDEVRLQDRFFEGAGSFRGFEVAGVGPRFLTGGGLSQDGNFFGQAIGAKIYGIGTAEVIVPLPLPKEYGIRASIFSDFGTVGLVDDEDKLINDNINFFVNPETGLLCSSSPSSNCIAPIQDDLSLRVTAGVSVSWDSPFGPVRFDLAEVFIREEFDQTEGFRFSAGTQF